jgi:hypothetical protein
MRPLVLLEFGVAPHTLTRTAQSRASQQSRVSRCGDPLLLLVDVYHSAVSPSTQRASLRGGHFLFLMGYFYPSHSHTIVCTLTLTPFLPVEPHL